MEKWLRLSRLILAAAISSCLSNAPLLAADPAPTGGAVPASLSTGSASVVGADYRIGPADQLEINVFQVADLTRTVQVDSSGRILLPLIGMVTAGGRTPNELSTDIAGQLQAKYMKDPQVTVTVKDAASEKVTIDGAVIQPGIYPLTGPTTLLQAIAMAKGPDDKTAETRKVALIRISNGMRYSTIYDLEAIRRGNTADPEVFGRDIIVIPGSGMKTFLHNFTGVAQVLALFRPW